MTNPSPPLPRTEVEIRQELAITHRLMVIGHGLGHGQSAEMGELKSKAECLIEELAEQK